MPTAALALLTALSLNQQQTPPTTPATPPAAAPVVAAPGVQATPAPTVPTKPAPAEVSTADETPDYPDAIMTPASPSNFRPANRPVEMPINMIVIHDIEGTAISTVHWFQNPKAQVTAHYIIGGDGTIYQSVKEHNVAWHAGNRNLNNNGIGIEHEGYAYRPGFYNPAEYEASARLVRTISTRYNIPRDRTHIIGHFEVPDLVHPGRFGGSGGHTDPGPWWDWDSYMTLVRSDARLGTVTLPTVLHPGETVKASVSLTNLGDDPWPSPAGPTGADRGSETANAIAQRALGLVYLGAYSPTSAPIPPPSAFFGAGWISPRFAAPVSADVAPGAEAAFSVTLHGPRTLGSTTEQFRLYRLPIAPRMPVAFGPTVTAVIDVKPWDITVDSNAPADAFQAVGWSRKEPDTPGVLPIYYLQGTKKPPRKSKNAPPVADITVSPAQWKQALPISGEWDVYVRWTPGAKRTGNAAYTVQSTLPTPPPANTTITAPTSPTSPPIIIDQRHGGGTWQLLGRYHFDGQNPAQVLLAPEAGKGSIVVADAVRFVGPFPAPPGTKVVPVVIPAGAGPRPSGN